MATTLAIRSGFDPGKIVRTLGGEYAGAWKNVPAVLTTIKSIVSESDYQHVKRILTSGCPSVVEFNEPV